MGNGTMTHRGRRSAGVRAGSLLAAALLVAASACGDDDGDDAVGITAAVDETDAEGADTEATDVEDTDVRDQTTVANGSRAVGEIDVCALLTKEEVEAVIGMPAGAAQPEESAAPYFGCRYEEDGLSQIVSIGVLAWGDAEEAETSFEFGADQYPAIEGIGDRAYNSQPIDDVSVLSGRYELSVGLYFVSDDDEAELAMASELAAVALDRLP
jgi:hypothetical protein